MKKTLFYEGNLIREVDNEEDLARVLRDLERVFALFYASWCPFCRSFLPIFEKYALENDRYKFLHVNINDETNPLWEKFDIEVVPTILLFEGDRVFKRLDGTLGTGLSERQLKELIEDSST